MENSIPQHLRYYHSSKSTPKVMDSVKSTKIYIKIPKSIKDFTIESSLITN